MNTSELLLAMPYTYAPTCHCSKYYQLYNYYLRKRHILYLSMEYENIITISTVAV